MGCLELKISGLGSIVVEESDQDCGDSHIDQRCGWITHKKGQNLCALKVFVEISEPDFIKLDGVEPIVVEPSGGFSTIWCFH